MASFRDVSKLVIQFTLLSSEHRVPVAQQIGFHSQLFNYSPSDESVVMSHVPNFPFPGYWRGCTSFQTCIGYSNVTFVKCLFKFLAHVWIGLSGL
jgi:hypothetical protein